MGKLGEFFNQWQYTISSPNPNEKVYSVSEVMALLEAAWDISQLEPFSSENPFKPPSWVNTARGSFEK